jgi:Uma2 family endonuclease
MMTLKTAGKQATQGRNGKQHRPYFVARTEFQRPEDLPPDLGLDGSPYSADGLAVSEAEYWEKYYEVTDYHYEWNNGVLEEKPVSDYATFKVYKWLFLLIDAFLRSHPIGRLVALETAFRMEFADQEKATIRKPDFFVVLGDNPAPYGDAENSFGGIADLCVEAISDTSRKNVERDTKTKRGEYELAGVSEFYMLDASGRHMIFLRRNAAGKFAPIPPTPDGVIRSETLPGFQFRIDDLYRQPPLVELSEDEVYRGFVLPELTAARRSAEQERARAEQEYARAEQEREHALREQARADRYAAKLRALGIAEDAP